MWFLSSCSSDEFNSWSTMALSKNYMINYYHYSVSPREVWQMTLGSLASHGSDLHKKPRLLFHSRLMQKLYMTFRGSPTPQLVQDDGLSGRQDPGCCSCHWYPYPGVLESGSWRLLHIWPLLETQRELTGYSAQKASRELCESRGGRPELPVLLIVLIVSVDVKLHCTAAV